MKIRRVFVSLPADQWLTKQENNTKWAIVAAIERLGYSTEVFLDPRGTHSLAAGSAWNADACEQVMRRCEGCVLLGFPRWRIPASDAGPVLLSTEFNHYEGAVAHTLNLPLLVLIQAGVQRRVVFDSSYEGYVGTLPPKPTPKWLETEGFRVPFQYWTELLQRRRDIFLGYCGSSTPTASKIKKFLEDGGVSVLDWKTDFDPATSILRQIEEASKRCAAGIFLFTKDDVVSDAASTDHAVPRDNVVFEAGYFSALKGKSRVLIVRESGAKMPADLGGDIYASLDDRNDIDPIQPVIRRFIDAL